MGTRLGSCFLLSLGFLCLVSSAWAKTAFEREECRRSALGALQRQCGQTDDQMIIEYAMPLPMQPERVDALCITVEYTFRRDREYLGRQFYEVVVDLDSEGCRVLSIRFTGEDY